ncbi:hypothetical protein GCM10010411_93850 [Actinomadura fulvescens]|uniref:Uncharacterized protein n=1 Tax=Actinomadura fulvescens TaxID=46160 RepID=A0ABP6DBT6_9ACTN
MVAWQYADGEFVEAGRYRAVAFEAVDAALNGMAAAVVGRVEPGRSATAAAPP